MRRTCLALAFVSSAVIALATLPTVKAGARASDLGTSARAFVETLARGDFAEAAKSFGPPLDGSLPPEELRKDWEGITAKGGPLEKVIGVRGGRVEEYAGRKYDVVVVQCRLSRARMNVRISFDRAGRITSLWFVAPDKN